ncbi:MAG: nuclear transport factor 2 family protein [Aigarchaeota archaeon]|nr:nuclear transport factor 2 family protein [Aigarchaeota archaeon]MDW8092979.1 nuclear transport factor 2 family protein [Nitrososphaerota archaeon]
MEPNEQIDEGGPIKVVIDSYEAIKNREMDRLSELHVERGYSRFNDLPPLELSGYEEAIRIKRSLMTQLADFNYQLKILDAMVIDNVAVVIYEVEYGGMLVYNYRFEGQLFSVRSRCTTILVKEGKSWKILHEHLSRMTD